MAGTFILIDDDPADLHVMKTAITKAAPTFNCISFLYSEEALSVLKNDLVKTPDYIIIDLNMPGKSGQDCLYELRKTLHYRHVPIILTSSYLPDIVRETLIQKGATFIVEKPTYEKWPEIIEKILKNDWKD